MTVKEYLSQGYRLEQRIKVAQREIEQLQEMAYSISSPGFEEHFNATRNTDSPYVKTIMKAMDLQDKMNQELDRLVQFKEELKTVINGVPNKDERMVLYYRYLCNETWSHIGDELGADERTVRRWHNRAIAHVTIPREPMIIDKFLEKM